MSQRNPSIMTTAADFAPINLNTDTNVQPINFAPFNLDTNVQPINFSSGDKMRELFFQTPGYQLLMASPKLKAGECHGPGHLVKK
jgi:hypothetical protein